MSYSALGVSASASFSTDSGGSSSSSGGKKKKGKSVADKLAAEMDMKLKAEAAASVASDLGARFFAGDKTAYAAAYKAIQQTMSLYRQAHDLAIDLRDSLPQSAAGWEPADTRAQDYTDRVEELQVAIDTMIKSLASGFVLPGVKPKAQIAVTPAAINAMKKKFFSKSIGLVFRQAGIPPVDQEAPKPFPWLLVGLGAAALVGVVFFVRKGA